MDMAARHRDIILTGFVEDLEDYLPRCRVNVIPLRFGSGMKVKTINGLCRGISDGQYEHWHRRPPGGRWKKDVFIADDLDTFIDRTALLLTDQQRWEELANNSKETAKAHYTWDSLYRILAENI